MQCFFFFTFKYYRKQKKKEESSDRRPAIAQSRVLLPDVCQWHKPGKSAIARCLAIANLGEIAIARRLTIAKLLFLGSIGFMMSLVSCSNA